MNQERSGSKHIIVESFGIGAREAFKSSYRDAQQATLEIIDNAVDNRIDGIPITVMIRTSKNELSVANKGGEGLDLEGLHSFFTWGESQKTDQNTIGQYGVGGKAAIAYLGKGMELVCSPRGSSREYRVTDSEWDQRPEGRLKEYEAQETPATDNDGYFRVTIKDLKREVNPQVLFSKLGEIYRPLLLKRSDGRAAPVKILLNGREVTPAEMRYMTTDQDLIPQRYKVHTRDGVVDLVLGVLEEGQKTKPGIRCYYRGRLMETDEFFGHPGPAQIPGTSRFIGEASMDFIPVTASKSGFDKGSLQWKSAEARLHAVIAPWIEKAARLKPNTETPVEKYEKDLAKRAKRVLDDVMATTGLITIKNIPGLSHGVIPPERTGGTRPEPIDRHNYPKSREGRTAPRLEATIGETVKRWSATHEVDVVSMGNDEIKSSIVDKNGKKVLIINSDFPLYQVTKRLGANMQQIYMAQTMSDEICKFVARSYEYPVEDFVELATKMQAAIGRVFESRIPERKGDRK